MTPTLQQLRERIERIEAEFERQRSSLFRGDGEQRFSGPEHAERLRAFEEERNGQVDRVMAELRELVDAAEREILIIENAPPTSWLDDAELSAANLRREFASDDVGSLPLGQLTRRLEAVLAREDRAEIFAYFIAARGRAELVQGSPGAGEEGAPASAALPDELRDVLDQMRVELLGDETRSRLERARALLSEAGEVEMRASYARAGAATAAGAWLNRRVRAS